MRDGALIDDGVLGRKLWEILDNRGYGSSGPSGLIGEYLLRHKFERMKEFRKDLLWKMDGNRVVENILDHRVGR